MRLLPLLALAALPLAAQNTSTIIDRANQGGPGAAAAPEAAEPAPAAPGADSDAGVQRVAEPRRLPLAFSASLDQQFYAASNVFLAADGAADADTGALVSASTLALGADTLPVVAGDGRLAFSASLVWQRNLHGLATRDAAIEDLDFDSYSLPLAASYRWGRGWEAVAGVTVGSLYSIRGGPSHELLHRSVVPALGLRKLSRISENLVGALGVSISYSDTWTTLHDVPAAPVDLRYRDDRNDRADVALEAALHAFRGPWTLFPSLRLARGSYLHWEEAGHNAQDRDDFTASAGLGVSYAFATWGAVRAYAGYDLRESSGGVADYDYTAASIGLGLGATLRF